MWVLGTELWSSTWIVNALNLWAISPPPFPIGFQVLGASRWPPALWRGLLIILPPSPSARITSIAPLPCSLSLHLPLLSFCSVGLSSRLLVYEANHFFELYSFLFLMLMLKLYKTQTFMSCLICCPQPCYRLVVFLAACPDNIRCVLNRESFLWV
jgi:hypothetical protein